MQLIDQNEMMFKQFDIRQKHRFLMTVSGIPSFLITTATLPSFSINYITLDYINSKRYVKGKMEWDTVDVTILDSMEVSQSVMEWVRQGHNSLTGVDGYDYRKDITIEQLGPVGDIIGKWTLKNTFIINGNFGDQDWSNDEQQTISLTLRYDYAIHHF